MSTATPLPGVHDPHLIHRTPISGTRFNEAWEAATNHGTDTPALRTPAAQVGTCRAGRDHHRPRDYPGCQGPLVPTEPPDSTARVTWFHTICTTCHTTYADRQPHARIAPGADARAAGWEPS